MRSARAKQSVGTQSRTRTLRQAASNRSLVAAVLLLVLSPAAQAAVKDLFAAGQDGFSRIDGTTGSHVYDNNTLNLLDLTFGPDGNAYVSSVGSGGYSDNVVLRVNPATGAPMGTFASDIAL